MNWVRVGKAYFNTDLIESFYWTLGKLWVHWLGEGAAERYEDPDRENYLRLCRRLGVRPVEEDEVNGESRI